jgi:thymidylate synthase ThyX
MKMIEGKCGIYANVVCDSICNHSGIRITTLELQYPRIVHSEFMTHRMFSRNAASSRAIPFNKMVEQLTGCPVRFGANQSGMQDAGDHDAFVEGDHDAFLEGDYYYNYEPEDAWDKAKKDAIKWSERFHRAGYHKQVVNRLTEPFQMIKVVCTATEWHNFLWLRDHDAADPTIAELAKCIHLALQGSTPVALKAGEWHLPYIELVKNTDSTVPPLYYMNDGDIGTTGFLSIEDAIKVSSARCAAVSFRNVDYGLEKSREIHEKLIGADRKHASAFEHQATPMQIENDGYTHDKSVNIPDDSSTWEPGVSHMDRDGWLWSGNFRGFIQHRKLIHGENFNGGY